CLVLLGMVCAGLVWEHSDITAVLSRWSHALQRLFMLEQSPTQAIEPTLMSNIEMTLPISAQDRSKNQDTNNQITRNPRDSLNNQITDSAESLAKGPASPSSREDVILDRKNVSNVRDQSQDSKIVIVQSGDALSKIIIREYGQYDRNILDSVLKSNPEIVNISRIEVGRRITLPKLYKPTTNN